MFKVKIMKKNKKKYTVVGLMSGTSLDGLDLALCRFERKGMEWKYAILKSNTYTYTKKWKDKLRQADTLPADAFWKLHVDFGKFSAKTILDFLKDRKETIDAIASHGHTVFHQPQSGFTCQIGEGATIAALSGIQTISDFRSMDIALGGQGAPLVPIGDELLFNKYQACLNIGGIANISLKYLKQRVAFDICPANLVFNYYAHQLGLTFDKGGKIAASGKIHPDLLNKLNQASYYKKSGAKSLGREWVEKNILELIDSYAISPADALATATEHAAIQIARVLTQFKIKNVLLSGGGTYNTYLLQRIRQHSTCQLIIPEDKTIQFKEALIFAFLGLLRLRNETNCLKQVTGAKRNSSGGAIYSPEI